MSTIITNNLDDGRFLLRIFAPDSRTIVTNVTFDNWIIDIGGKTEKPFIVGALFKNCKIITEDLSAFHGCYFDKSCEILIESLPKDERVVDRINHNYVEGKAISSQFTPGDSTKDRANEAQKLEVICAHGTH